LGKVCQRLGGSIESLSIGLFKACFCHISITILFKMNIERIERKEIGTLASGHKKS